MAKQNDDVARLAGTEPDRRQIIRGLALGAASMFSMPAEARPPTFISTAGGQYMEIEPREDVSAIVIRDLAGKAWPLSQYRGRPALVAFWATWCPPCIWEIPILHRLQQRSAELGFAVIPISLDKDVDRARQFIRRLKLQGFASFADPDGVVASGPKSTTQTPFQLYGMPMSYLVDPHVRTAGHLAGAADWSSPDAIRLIDHYS